MSKARIELSDNDLSCFALESGLLALDYRDFEHSGLIKPFPLDQRVTKRLPYSLGNRGLLFHVDIALSAVASLLQKGALFNMPLNCYEAIPEMEELSSEQMCPRPIVLTLRKEVAGDEERWRRHQCRSFQGPQFQLVDPGSVRIQTAFYIRQDGL